jgi:hypothetical protein
VIKPVATPKSQNHPTTFYFYWDFFRRSRRPNCLCLITVRELDVFSGRTNTATQKTQAARFGFVAPARHGKFAEEPTGKFRTSSQLKRTRNILKVINYGLRKHQLRLCRWTDFFSSCWSLDRSHLLSIPVKPETRQLTSFGQMTEITPKTDASGVWRTYTECAS